MTNQEKQYFLDILKEVRDGENSRFVTSKQYKHHGKTSVYKHSLNVAYMSYKLAKRWNLNVDYRALLRGALLHDYFLYDWHVGELRRPLHGFYHPGKALENADKDFDLNETERDIIKKHMFPLTMYVPRHKESWIVCMVDKWTAAIETMKRR